MLIVRPILTVEVVSHFKFYRVKRGLNKNSQWLIPGKITHVYTVCSRSFLLPLKGPRDEANTP